jgi:hypothetical protein
LRVVVAMAGGHGIYGGDTSLEARVDSLESSRGEPDGLATLGSDGLLSEDQRAGGGVAPVVTLIEDFGSGASAESNIEPRVIDFGTWLRLSGRVRILPETPVAAFDEPMFLLPEGVTAAAYETRSFLVYQYELDGGGLRFAGLNFSLDAGRLVAYLNWPFSYTQAAEIFVDLGQVFWTPA